MTPNTEKRKYDVTIVETVVHNFTVEVEGDEDPYEAAEEEFVQAENFTDLENYSEAISNREVEDARPQP